MVAEDRPQGPVEHVGSGVTLADPFPAQRVDRQLGLLADLKRAGLDCDEMTMQSLDGVTSVVHSGRSGFGDDRSGVPYLPARFGIEGSEIDEDLPLLALLETLAGFSFDQDGEHLSPVAFPFVSGECGEAEFVGELAIDLPGSGGVASLPRRPSPLALRFHLRLEALFVNDAAPFGDDFRSELDRESVCVVELEGHCPGEDTIGHFFEFLVEQLDSRGESAAEPALLAFDGGEYDVPTVEEFGIC